MFGFMQAPNVGVGGRDHGNRRNLFVIQFFDIESNELLAEDDIRESDYDNAEQYAKNFMDDNFDPTTTYFTVS